MNALVLSKRAVFPPKPKGLGGKTDNSLETLWVDDVGFADVETTVDLATFLSHLPSLEAEVLQLRWGINEAEPLSLRAIAARLGKGKTWVGDTEKAALNKLRKIANKEENHLVVKKKNGHF